MSEPKYVATVKIEKVTPTNRTIGFSSEKADPTTEQVASITLTNTDLTVLKGKVAEHLNIVGE